MSNKIYPYLWFDGVAREAAEFYCSIFKDAKIASFSSMVAEFELDGTRYMGLNGGPMFTFNEAVSIIVKCEIQEEVDYYWNKLIADLEKAFTGN